MILLAFAACGDDGGGDGMGGVDAGPEFGECPSDSTADEMAGAGVILAKCQNCHASDAANRQGAPSTVTFDNASLVRSQDNRIFARAVQGSSMPPAAGGGALSTDEKEQVRIYLACGVTLDPQ